MSHAKQIPADVVMISGCKDEQVSYDVYDHASKVGPFAVKSRTLTSPNSTQSTAVFHTCLMQLTLVCFVWRKSATRRGVHQRFYEVRQGREGQDAGNAAGLHVQGLAG
eukprot:5604527-Pyramimonas_sp.AAC.1